MPATTTPSRPGPVRRAGRWLNTHPKVVGAILLAVGMVQIGLIVVDRPDHVFLPSLLLVFAGALSVFREHPRTTRTHWIVPGRWVGGRRVPLGAIEHLEVAADVWSLAPSVLVLRDGERVTLRGVDRLFGAALAEQAGVEIRRV